MNFEIIWNRLRRYFCCFKKNRKPQIEIDDILEAEYGRLNDPDNPTSYF
jgi:hypothetical protein